MKRLISIFLITFSFSVVAQKDTLISNKTSTSFKNQMDLDIHFLAVEFTYKKRISKRLMGGVSVGIGPIFRGFVKNSFIEGLKSKFFVDYQVSDKFHIYQGVTYSAVLYSSHDNSGLAIGIEMGLFYQFRKVEIGVEPALIFFNEGNFEVFNTRKGYNTYGFEGLTWSLIVLKIPLKRW